MLGFDSAKSTFRTVLVASAIGGAVVACSLALNTSGTQCSKDADCIKFSALAVCQNNVCITPDASVGIDANMGDDASPSDDASGDASLDGFVDAGPPPIDANDPAWGCLGSVPPYVPKKPIATVTEILYDVVTRAAISDVDVCLCNRLDTMCTSPLNPDGGTGLGKPITPVPLFDGGSPTISVQVPTGNAGFDGFLIATPKNHVDGGAAATCPPVLQTDAGLTDLIPARVFFNPPIIDDTQYYSALLLTHEELYGIAVEDNVSIDNSLGSYFFQAVNCQGVNASDVNASINPKGATTIGFYLIGGTPVTTATATDTTAQGGFVNVPTGFSTITAGLQLPPNTSPTNLIGKATADVRPGFISYSVLIPSPQ